MDLKTKFDNAIKNTLNYNEKLYRSDINYPMYFNKDYVSKMEMYLKKDGLIQKLKLEMQSPAKAKSKEIKKMCSVASSSRLCLFYTRQLMKECNVSIDVEKQCDNGLNSGDVPHLDAWCKNTNTYYECKCHEICNESHDKLKVKYKEKLQLFNIDDSKLNIIEEIENGKNQKFYDMRLSHLGINNDQRPIHKLHFDIKQFMCHLIGIENSDKNESKLKYIFFSPNEKFIDTDIKLLYETLKSEINMIINCDAIKYFFDKHAISFDYEIVPVDTFDDLIVKSMDNTFVD